MKIITRQMLAEAAKDNVRREHSAGCKCEECCLDDALTNLAAIRNK